MPLLLTDIKRKMKRYKDPDKFKTSKVLTLDKGGSPGVSMIQFKSVVKGSGRKNYETTVQFFKVKFKDEPQGKGFRKIVTKGIDFFHRIVKVKENPVKLKCSCDSYRFEYEAQNFEASANIGAFRKYRRKTSPRQRSKSSRNPNKKGRDFVNALPLHNVPGMCKHIATLLKALKQKKEIK